MKPDASAPLKIAMITTSFPLREQESSGVFVLRLVEALQTSSRSFVEVVTPAPSFPTPINLRQDITIKTFRYAPRRLQKLAHEPGGLPVAINSPHVIWLFPFLVSLFLSCYSSGRRNDLIHANWSVLGAISGLIGKLLKKPVVTTLRGEDISRSERSALFRYFLNSCLQTNRRIICVSEEMAVSLRARFPKHRDKVIFIPNGVSSEFFKIQRDYNQQKSPPTLTAIIIGSLIPRKSVATAISAIAAMPENLRPHLRIIGDGEELADLSGHAKSLGVSNVVHFMGSVPPDKVLGCLKQADIFLLCSLSEGRPNVLLEAMASALPIIATDISGVRELIEDNKQGLLFPPRNHLMLSEKLVTLCSSPALRKSLSEASRKKVSELGISWEATANAYYTIYSDILGGVS